MSQINEAFVRSVVLNGKFNIYNILFYRLREMLPLNKDIHSKKQTIDEALVYIRALCQALDIADVNFTSNSFV